MENNEFEFNELFYKQIIGAPMGGLLSPTSTDLHLSGILNKILDKFQHRENINLHCQYRDDGFMTFSGNVQQIEHLFKIANNIDPLLKFTYEYSYDIVTYLDTEIYKGERFKQTGILDIKSHIKKTETYQYLSTDSSHPKHTFNSITKAETIRHIRNNSNEKELNIHLSTLKNKLIKRGYNRNKTNEIINKTKDNTDRVNILSHKHRDKNIPLTMVTKYNPVVKNLNRILRKHWDQMIQDKVCKHIFIKKPIIAYKHNKNLKEYFAKARS